MKIPDPAKNTSQTGNKIVRDALFNKIPLRGAVASK
jgi:hypothetical protein